MKLMFVLALALPLPPFCPAKAGETTNVTPPLTNALALPQGWLLTPSRELVLDVQQIGLEYGARQDASEFVAGVLSVLLGANYNVQLSDEMLQGEINYYRANLTREVPVEMSGAILSCLEHARAAGVIDWDCFKERFKHTTELTGAERHLPWMAPPLKARAISLAGAASTNRVRLHLSLKWTGRNYGGGVQYSRRPGSLPGESVLREGQSALWAFDAVMGLTKDGQARLEKLYPREDWQRSYITIYDQPLWKTSQAILQDIAAGLRPPKPASSGQGGKTKPSKHSQAAPQANSKDTSSEGKQIR